MLLLLVGGDTEPGVQPGSVDGYEVPVGPDEDLTDVEPESVDGALDPVGPDPADIAGPDGLLVPTGPTSIARSIPVGTVDGALTPSGPTPGTPDGAAVMTVDGAVPVPGPQFITHTGGDPPDPSVFVPLMRARLFDRAGTTLVANLDNAFAVEWQEVSNDTGVGRFSLALSDADAALIADGQVVYCELYGDPQVYAWRVEAHPADRLAPDEEFGQIVQVSGRGRAGMLDAGRVYPFGGVDAVPTRSTRSFSFASPDYDSSSWGAAVAVAVQGDMSTPWVVGIDGVLYAAPVAWPELPIVSSWLWDHAPPLGNGKAYFRETFTTADEANVTIVASGDNYWTLYLDGVAILGDTVNPLAWQEHRKAELVLPAGDHTFAAVVDNLGFEGAFLLAMFVQNDDQTLPPDMILISDGGWQALGYPTVEPGWTPGGIMLTLLAEAQARGVLTDVTVDFTSANDSAGVPWQTIPEFAVNVGTSYLEVLGTLTEEGWIDWYMTPGAPRLSMWAKGTQGGSTSVVLAAAVNLGDLTHAPAGAIVNRLLVSYASGMFVIDDLASQGVVGVIEGYLTVDAADSFEAHRLAAKSLATSSDPTKATTAKVEPQPDGSSADRPYVDFHIGDTVTSPNDVMAPVTMRVLGITITGDDEGNPSIALELNRRVTNVEERRLALLRTLGSGVVGDAPGSKGLGAAVWDQTGPYFPPRAPTLDSGPVRADNSTPDPTSGTGGDGLSEGEIVFSYGGLVNQPSISTPWVAPADIEIFEVVLAALSDGVADVTVKVNIDGTAGIDYDLNSGTTLTIHTTSRDADEDDIVYVQLTSIGSGDVTGLSVILRWRLRV